MYRLLAIDLDGTLLDPKGNISDANRIAVAQAQAAGIEVVPCTGRGWREARKAIAQLPDLTLGVFITGAVVADVTSGQSVDLAVIEPHLAFDLVQALADEPEAVLVYREANYAGHEYLVTGGGELGANTTWWFKITNARVHHQRDVTAEDLHHTLRVGMVARTPRLPALVRRIEERFGGDVLMHHFEALHFEDEDQSLHVLEIFATGVDKWRGLSWIAQQRAIEPTQIAAIGDQINDLSMLSGAGCGIAMANAIPAAKASANYITTSNTDHGVAAAIQRLLDGQW